MLQEICENYIRRMILARYIRHHSYYNLLDPCEPNRTVRHIELWQRWQTTQTWPATVSTEQTSESFWVQISLSFLWSSTNSWGTPESYTAFGLEKSVSSSLRSSGACLAGVLIQIGSMNRLPATIKLHVSWSTQIWASTIGHVSRRKGLVYGVLFVLCSTNIIRGGVDWRYFLAW